MRACLSHVVTGGILTAVTFSDILYTHCLFQPNNLTVTFCLFLFVVTVS